MRIHSDASNKLSLESTNINPRYFAAVGGDAPAFEVWPTKKDYNMHEYLLALWGMIVGEMFDLEVSKERA